MPSCLGASCGRSPGREETQGNLSRSMNALRATESQVKLQHEVRAQARPQVSGRQADWSVERVTGA